MAVVRRAREEPVEAKAVRAARERHGVRSVKMRLARDSGYPDRMFLVPGGRPLFVEFKRPGAEVDVDSVQGGRMAGLRALGYDVLESDDVDEVLEVLRARLRAVPCLGCGR